MDNEVVFPVMVSRNPLAKRGLDDDVVYVSGHTLHPPEHDIDPDELKKIPAYISDLELSDLDNHGKEISCKDAYLLLTCREGQFDKTKNPVYAIQAFLIAHDAGLYPPMWALNYMADIFKKYHEAEGTISLDKLFGLTRGKGQNNALLETVLYNRDEELMIEIAKLRGVFGCTVDQAAHMVARLLEEMPYDKYNSGVLKIKKLSEETLKNKFNKEWYKLFKDTDFNRRVYSNWSEERKKDHLKDYPEDSIPDRLKHLLD